MITTAMIFAAGFGTRMGALTKATPKPLVQFAGRALIDHTIDLLSDAGVTRIVANAHYLADDLIHHLEGTGVMISDERDRILDTGGGLRAALPKLDANPVITINPDVFWLDENPVSTLIKAWHTDMNALLMVIPENRVFGTDGAGDFALNDGVLHRGGAFQYGGAQIIRTDQLHKIKDDVFSLNAYWDRLSANGGINGLEHNGRWCDIGTPEGLRVAEGLMTRV